MKSVWVLTTECNDYDQHREYLNKIFPEKPSREKLQDIVGDMAYVDLLLTMGGGRLKDDYQWWHLVEYKF